MKNSLLAICFLLVMVSCTERATTTETTDTNVDEVTFKPLDSTATQEKVISDAHPPRTPIDIIKKEVARINNANLPSKRHDFMCDEKAYVVYHYNGKDIAKVTIDWGTVGDAYHREEFYYKDGKLIFDYDLLEGAGAYPGGDKKLERRHYVENDKVIRYLEGQTGKPCEYCDYKKSSVAYRALAADASKDYKGELCR